MPDIAMCRNRVCPLRGDCYRYRAVPAEYQTFGDFRWHHCQYHWPISEATGPTEEVDRDA